MRRLAALTLTPLLCLGACAGGAGSSGSTGTFVGSSTGSRTGRGESSGGRVGGTSSGGSSSAGTTGGGASSGGGPCAPGATWVGHVCALAACSPTVAGAGCLLPDGGVGACADAECLDVGNDSLNCGFPGAHCAAGFSCMQGICAGSGPGCSGPAGCGPAGICGGNGSYCITRFCDGGEPDGVVCSYGSPGICCGSVCTGLDATNCGACGSPCGAGEVCESSSNDASALVVGEAAGDPAQTYGYLATAACVPAPSCVGMADNAPCPGGFCCDGACLPSSNADPLNCGACGAICPSVDGGAASCAAGICAGDCSGCPAGDGCGHRTVIVGGLGLGGSGDGGSSSESELCLAPSCPAGHDGLYCGSGDGGGGTCCGTACLDTTELNGDPHNCGACGTVCPPDLVCAGGACTQEPPCSLSSEGHACLVDAGIGGLCCGGQCVDATNDPLDCGQCGVHCPLAGGCSSGACTPTACQSASDCPAGDGCTGGTCWAPCSALADGDACGPGEICCGGSCTLPQADDQNCGACGVVCPIGYHCRSGLSTTCAGASGGLSCTGQNVTCPQGYGCVEVGFFFLSSAGCLPRDCSGRANGEPCTNGPYALGSCCGGSCVSVREDPANCGGCGFACPAGVACQDATCVPPDTCSPPCAAGQICASGLCVTSLCNSLTCAAPDGQPGSCCGLGCLDLKTDPQNCGGCGQACPSGEACQGGACQGDACSDADEGLYCALPDATQACCGNACVDVTSDPANCGGCGSACLPGQACNEGLCQ
ncbi:MAG TPA: hypothetical protein VMB50_08275 [Myxococcales bacterium]|nr:hypothetical protein [Myxococcales bacterium]